MYQPQPARSLSLKSASAPNSSSHAQVLYAVKELVTVGRLGVPVSEVEGSPVGKVKEPVPVGAPVGGVNEPVGAPVGGVKEPVGKVKDSVPVGKPVGNVNDSVPVGKPVGKVKDPVPVGKVKDPVPVGKVKVTVGEPVGALVGTLTVLEVSTWGRGLAKARAARVLRMRVVFMLIVLI